MFSNETNGLFNVLTVLTNLVQNLVRKAIIETLILQVKPSYTRQPRLPSIRDGN